MVVAKAVEVVRYVIEVAVAVVDEVAVVVVAYVVEVTVVVAVAVAVVVVVVVSVACKGPWAGTITVRRAATVTRTKQAAMTVPRLTFFLKSIPARD